MMKLGSSICMHVPSTKLFNKFQLHLVLEVYIKSY
jgi:hypothetical protein